MALIIAAEQFGLTEAIREHAERSLDRLADSLPPGAPVRMFLRTAGGDDGFTALCRVHVRGTDLVSHVSDPNLYAAISRSTGQLRRKLLETRKRRLNRRRRDP